MACRRLWQPSTNAQYWLAKIRGNVERYERQLEQLEAAGWSALTVWECEIADESALAARLSRFLDVLATWVRPHFATSRKSTSSLPTTRTREKNSARTSPR